jgi:hypothetical protein
MSINRNSPELCASERPDDECPWETGALGRDADFVRVVEPASADLDDGLGLQMISIRLEKTLLRDLKEIAAVHGMGYQPMVRDLLNRFAKAEIRSILEARLRDLAEAERANGEPPGPVTDFIERQRKTA